jgi:hypothetical protein
VAVVVPLVLIQVTKTRSPAMVVQLETVMRVVKTTGMVPVVVVESVALHSVHQTLILLRQQVDTCNAQQQISATYLLLHIVLSTFAALVAPVGTEELVFQIHSPAQPFSTELAAVVVDL